MGINRLNPYEPQALTAALAYKIEQTASDSIEKKQETARIARQFAANSPVNADLSALYAQTLFAQQEDDKGQIINKLALHLDPLNPIAVRREIMTSRSIDDFKQSIDRLDSLFRRNSAWMKEFQPVLLALVKLNETRPILQNKLLENPRWAESFFRRVGTDEEVLNYLPGMLLPLQQKFPQQYNSLSYWLMRILIQKEHHALAHRLYLFSKSTTTDASGAYLKNGELAFEPDGNPFNWNYYSNSSVAIEWRKLTENNGRIAVEFLHKPLKNIHLRQYFSVPRGNYTLSITMDGRSLKLPQPVSWQITCSNTNQIVSRVDVTEGSYKEEIKNLSFSNSANNPCKMFRIDLMGRSNVSNFAERYSGTLYLKRAVVVRSSE